MAPQTTSHMSVGSEIVTKPSCLRNVRAGVCAHALVCAHKYVAAHTPVCSHVCICVCVRCPCVSCSRVGVGLRLCLHVRSMSVFVRCLSHLCSCLDASPRACASVCACEHACMHARMAIAYGLEHQSSQWNSNTSGHVHLSAKQQTSILTILSSDVWVCVRVGCACVCVRSSACDSVSVCASMCP